MVRKTQVRRTRTEKRQCECGKWQYGYEIHRSENSRIYICFTCGKFESFGIFTERMAEMFSQQPVILMHLIETEFITPIRL